MKPVRRDDERTGLTREQAVAAARSTGCEGAHEVDGGWMPCSSPEELSRVSRLAESDRWLESSVMDKDGVSPSGRRRKRRVRRWDNLTERSYGMTGVPGLGVVSAPPAKPTSPMGDSYASGPSGVITLTAEGKTFAPFTPDVGEPDVYTSPDAARMRARQIGCTGIRRYTTQSGRQVWMPCTTGVTYDRNMGYGAYSRTGSRLESARVEREVRRQLRAAGFSGKKSARRLAATPAKPSERISGSSVNKPGSSASTRSASGIVLSAEQQKALVVKAREHNAEMRKAGKPKWSMTSSATLKAVMRRGMGAFSSSHRPDVSSRQQWGMGRVNAFLLMLRTGKPKNARYTTDNDLLPKGHPWKERSQSTKKQPIDADGDGWVDEGKPTRRFIGFNLPRRAKRPGVSGARASDVAGSGGTRRRERSIRVSAGPGLAGRARARRLSRQMDETVADLGRGRSVRSEFKPKIIGNVPERISSDRLRKLKPQRVNHNSLVATQKAYPKAPPVEGDYKAATVADLGTTPNGALRSTFDHFGIGKGEIPAERRALHEKIIESVLFGNGKWSPKKQETPAVWFMGGGPASGKTFLRQGGFFDTPPRGDAVHLDADEIKQMLPEFDALVKELTDAGMDPTAAASAVHSESTYIQRMAMARAAQEGFHIVLDSTGDGGPASFNGKISVLKDAGYKIKGRFADVSIGKALSDAKTRQKEEKRGVPDDVLVDTHIDVARAVLYGLQYDIFDDLEIVSNEDHSSPATMAAFKDGVLVVHDPKKWSQFIAKARLAFSNEYETDYFDGAGKGARGKGRRAAEAKPRRARVREAEGADMLVADPVRSLAEALPKTGTDYKKVKAVPAEKRAAIAEAYNGLPDRSPEAKAAYDALQTAIEEHFRMLTEDLGVDVQFVDEDPYADAIEMMDDIENNGVLKVLRTSATGSHPYWSDQTNDMFRAVHDAFGHAATGRGFDRHGEEAAYQAHRSMVEDGLARLALATETRGQNSWLIENGSFPDQKMALLSEELAKQAAGLPQMPMMASVPEVDPQAAVQYEVPATADQDNAFETTRCHHVSGGRRVPPMDAETDRSSLYSSLGEDVRLSPETRQKLYEFAALGAQSLDGSGFDESNPRIVAQFKKAKRAVAKVGKGVVADIPVSAVESIPDSFADR